MIFFDVQVPEVYMPLLERLLVVQIDSYPQYSERMQSACCKSILKVLVALASKGPVLWSFISSVGTSARNDVKTCYYVFPQIRYNMTSAKRFTLLPFAVHQSLIRVCSKPLLLPEVRYMFPVVAAEYNTVGYLHIYRI